MAVAQFERLPQIWLSATSRHKKKWSSWLLTAAWSLLCTYPVKALLFFWWDHLGTVKEMNHQGSKPIALLFYLGTIHQRNEPPRNQPHIIIIILLFYLGTIHQRNGSPRNQPHIIFLFLCRNLGIIHPRNEPPRNQHYISILFGDHSSKEWTTKDPNLLHY